MIKLLFLPAIILLATFFYAPTFAQNIFEPGCDGVQGSTLCEDTKTDPENPISGPNGVIVDAIQIVTIIVGVAAVIMIIIGGIQYVLSTGDPAKVSSAKNTILYAFIGIVVALFAQALVLFVVRRI